MAYLDRIIPAGETFPSSVRVVRDGRIVPMTAQGGDLEDGDKVYVLPRPPGQRDAGERVVVVRYLLNNVAVPVRPRVQVGAGTADHYTVRAPKLAGLLGAPLAIIKAALQRANLAKPIELGGSKGAGDQPAACFNAIETRSPRDFEALSLKASSSYLVAGRREIFLAWQGGRAPFRITVQPHQSVEPAVDVRNIEACTARLPALLFKSGERYTVTITDANGGQLVERNLFAASEAPAPPRELRLGLTDPEARELYVATWLATTQDGAWAFEAQQRIGLRGCASAARRVWLEPTGLPPECEAPR